MLKVRGSEGVGGPCLSFYFRFLQRCANYKMAYCLHLGLRCSLLVAFFHTAAPLFRCAEYKVACCHLI